jgi:hypothetical protein
MTAAQDGACLARRRTIMSSIIRTALVAIALLGTVSAASAHSYGYGHKHGYWTKSHDGKWTRNTGDFFRQLKKNGS